jgi:Raf kinase inhibitor-like YbhB/YbcL family protein
MRKLRWFLWFLLAVIVETLLGCESPVQPNTPSLELKSSSFSGDSIPGKYSSCDGQDGKSPALSWSRPPEQTQSFALIAFDRDSLFGYKFTHWVLYDIPADKHDLAEDIAKQAQLPDGSRQGPNDNDKIGYFGPCPPGHSPHHYVFDLYALDVKLNLPAGASKKQVIEAITGHVLGHGELVGTFQH